MEKTKRRHILYDHPYVGALVAGLLTFFWASSVGVTPAVGLGVFEELTGEVLLPAEFLGTTGVITTFAIGLSALLCLLIHRLWFRRDGYKGCFTRTTASSKEAKRFVFVLLMIHIISFILERLVDDTAGPRFVLPTLQSLAVSFCAGTYEETTFRAIPVSIMMKNNPSRGRMLSSVILTSIVFGIVHMINVSAGAAVSTAIYQSFGAMCIGAFLGAVYIRTGNIFITMVYHFLHDVISMMDPQSSTGVMTQTAFSAFTLVLDGIFYVVCIAGAIYLLRKSKWEQIKSRWAYIWAE